MLDQPAPSTTTIMSMSEITRVAPWALRGLGFSFGVAERATPMLAWTEATLGQALRMLTVGEPQITAALGQPAPRRRRAGPAAYVIEAEGRSLIELGPPAIDLATADARAGGRGHVALAGAIDAWMAGSLAELAVRRGLGVVILYGAGRDGVMPASLPRCGWIAGRPAPSGALFMVGSLDGGAVDPALWRLLPARAFPEAAADAGLAAAAGAGGQGHLAISLARDLPDVEVGDLPLTGWPERVADAYRRGVTVDTADCLNLYELERRTWAPTSERSRSQAGY